jgi:hypothetical protein
VSQAIVVSFDGGFPSGFPFSLILDLLGSDGFGRLVELVSTGLLGFTLQVLSNELGLSSGLKLLEWVGAFTVLSVFECLVSCLSLENRHLVDDVVASLASTTIVECPGLTSPVMSFCYSVEDTSFVLRFSIIDKFDSFLD